MGVPPKRGRSANGLNSVRSRRAAENGILDQRVIIVSEESYDNILAVLDRPPEANEKIAKLFSTKAPWER